MSIVVSGCAIRFGPNGPYALNNSAHHNIGAQSLSVEADGDLRIVQKVQAPIVSMTAAQDETMARLGITAGASGGDEVTIIRFYRNGAFVHADDPILQTPNLNLWMTWVNDV